MSRVDALNRLLPQTQCRDCGFSGCLPYAQALDSGQAAVNLCAPGGLAVMQDVAALLQRPPADSLPTHQNALAVIDEAVCIGCTACIRACPVDAIMGASKRMHTVLADECTGCGLCVPPCPVDCIDMRPVSDQQLPRARHLSKADVARFAAAEHALARYQARNERRRRQTAQKPPHSSRTISSGQPEAAAAPPVKAADLIARAMANAQAQQSTRSTPANREAFREQQIKAAQEKATYRRYVRAAQYGSGAEQAEAIEWLRRHKAEEEAKAAQTR